MATNNALNAKNVGVQCLDTSGVLQGRTLTGTSNQISVSNGDGTAGNPTLSLTSTIQVTGISFDSGTNTLSKYTQGTFTPTMTGSTSNPTVTYSVQLGRYTQIGNRAIINLSLTLASFSGGAGIVQFTTPFTTAANTGHSMGTISLQNVGTSQGQLFYKSKMDSSTTVVQIVGFKTSSVAIGIAFAADVAATSAFKFSFIIEV